MSQSPEHPDGWGVSYYVSGSPHVIKSTSSAIDDHIFRKVSGVVTSQSVIAHIRKATHGTLSVLDTHPFQHGPWTFAHNGNIKGFSEVRPRLADEVDETLRIFNLGDTDSELFFFLILTELMKETDIFSSDLTLDTLASSCTRAIDTVVRIAGPLYGEDGGPPTENYLSFLIANGNLILGCHGGKNLYFSTHKTRCSERDSCSFFAPVCEAKAEAGDHVKHLVVSSETLQTENVWRPMSLGDFVGVDQSMSLSMGNLLR